MKIRVGPHTRGRTFKNEGFLNGSPAPSLSLISPN